MEDRLHGSWRETVHIEVVRDSEMGGVQGRVRTSLRSRADRRNLDPGRLESQLGSFGNRASIVLLKLEGGVDGLIRTGGNKKWPAISKRRTRRWYSGLSTRFSTSVTIERRSNSGHRNTFNTALISLPVVKASLISSRACRQR